jgi:hypothetical protein
MTFKEGSQFKNIHQVIFEEQDEYLLASAFLVGTTPCNAESSWMVISDAGTNWNDPALW